MTTDRVIREYNGVSKVDPVVMRENIGKVVEIKTSYDKLIKGTVVTIDPISESYVLAIARDNSISMTLVMGQYVKAVDFLPETPSSFNIKGLNLCESADGENQKKTLNRLKEWLQKNMIPVEQDNDVLRISDSLFIYPPYRAEDVISSNEMVLHKILGIIDMMPPA